MHPHPQQTAILTPLPPQHPDLQLVMYRVDQLAIEMHKLREEMRHGFAQVHRDFRKLKKDQEHSKKKIAEQGLDFNKESSAQRLEFKSELSAHREEFKADLSACRAEFRAELSADREKFQAGLSASRAEFQAEMQAFHEKSRQEFEAMLERTRIDVKELVASVVASVDDKVKLSGQASDLRLLKWCARAALSSSAAAGSLAYAVSKLMT